MIFYSNLIVFHKKHLLMLCMLLMHHFYRRRDGDGIKLHIDGKTSNLYKKIDRMGNSVKNCLVTSNIRLGRADDGKLPFEFAVKAPCRVGRMNKVVGGVNGVPSMRFFLPAKRTIVPTATLNDRSQRLSTRQ